MIRCLIVEDEKSSQELLLSRINKAFPEISVAGVIASVEEAINFLKRNRVEILFLDNQIKGGMGLISAALSVNLPALVLSRAVQAVGAGWLTRVAGRSFITYFQQDQDWGDGGMQEVVQRQYDLNRRDSALKAFLSAAFSRVVEPLQRQQKQEQLPPRPAGKR